MHAQNHRRDSGAALFVAVLMLALMGALGLAALDATNRDRQTAGFYNRIKTALYAAEAGGAHGRSIVRTVTNRSQTPAFPTQGVPRQLGDAALYDREAALPAYYGDPAVANPIRWIQDGSLYSSGGNLNQKGQKYVHTLWQINVTGQSPDGSTARLEVMESKVLTKGY